MSCSSQPSRPKVAPVGTVKLAEKLTVRSVEKHIAAGREVDVRDAAAPGLVLRIRASGSWKWTLRRAFQGRDARIDLGDEWTLDEARDIAAEATRRVKMGWAIYLSGSSAREGWDQWLRERLLRKNGIPQKAFSAPERPKPPPAPTSVTFREAIDLYYAELERTRRTTTATEYRLALLGPEMRELLPKTVRDLKRTDFAAAVAAIHRRGAERHAEVVATVLRGLWRFLGSDAMRKQTAVDPDEMRGLRPPERSLVEDTDGDEGLHVPEAAEIGRIVRWLRSDAATERDRLAGTLLVYTVQRRRAVALARKADFESIGNGTGLWRLPPLHRKSASRAKRKGRDVGVHIVPLPPSAWGVVERAKDLASDSEYLFPAMRQRRAGKEATTMHPSLLTHLFAEIPDSQASPHDMRRAFATTYRVAAGLLVADCGLILDHGRREDNEGAEAVTATHYAFSGIGKKAWSIMRGWIDFVDACAAACESSAAPNHCPTNSCIREDA
jgi:hypothetical protein